MPPLLARLFGHWGFLKTLVVLETETEKKKGQQKQSVSVLSVGHGAINLSYQAAHMRK